MVSRVAIVCLLALSAAGCDRQSAAPGQANVTAASGEATSEEVTGAEAAAATIGIDRSHRGEAAPTVIFAGPDGKRASLAAFKGKPVLMNLWATWCGPCVAELPTLNAAAASLAGKVQVIAVSQDTQAAAKVPAFLADHGATALAPYVDATMALSLGYQANLPTTILFGSDGKEVWRWRGGNDWTGAKAKALIAEAS